MRKVFTALYSFFSLSAFAQIDSIAYSRDYEFTEGIYLTASQFRQNNPILKSSIVSGIPKSEIDFFKQVIEQKNIVYKDTTGQEQKIETSSLWGYCQNRSVYINFNKEFNKLNVIGTLCHFTAIIINPFGVYKDPISYNYGTGIINTNEELGQFVFNSQTNKVHEFNVENMEILLKNDADLYNQFMVIKKRKKPDAIFVYLRKYNEKHSLYLPQK